MLSGSDTDATKTSPVKEFDAGNVKRAIKNSICHRQSQKLQKLTPNKKKSKKKKQQSACPKEKVKTEEQK